MSVREVEVWLQSFLTSALDGADWFTSCPGHFSSQDRTPLLIKEAEWASEPVCMFVTRERSRAPARS
jgi:hypothetical protein